MQVWTIYNTKGGSAKSTLAANLAGALAASPRNARVLLIDGDPQGTLTKAFEISPANPANRTAGGYRELLRMALAADQKVDLTQVVWRTNVDGIDIVPANLPLDELESLLKSSQEGYLRLRMIMDQLRGTTPYDFVIIDSTGTHNVVSYVCAVAADLIISPIIPDRVNVEAFFSGAQTLLSELSSNVYAPYRNMPVKAVIVRKKRTSDSDSFTNMLVKQLAPEETQAHKLLNRVRLVSTTIPDSAAYPKASTAKRPVNEIDPTQGEIIASLAAELAPLAAVETAGAAV